MATGKQPFKSLAEFQDDEGFEYLPSEQSSQANHEDQQDQVHELQVSVPNTYNIQQEKFSPAKIRQSNQSLAYSASSYGTEVMSSPQFGHPQQNQPHILVNVNQQQTKEINPQVYQMMQNLSQIPLQPNNQYLNSSQQQQSNNHQQSVSKTHTNSKSFENNQVGVYPVNLASYQASNKASTVLKNSEVQGSPSKSVIQSGPSKENSSPQFMIEQLQAEVSSLSEQLTQERLNSEQLRVYNHIIKHELEKKLINHGVFIVKDKTRACKQLTPTKQKRAPKVPESAIDLYLEMQHNRIQMQAIQSEYKQKDQIIKHLEVQLKQQNDIAELVRRHDSELEQQNEKLQESIQRAMESIENANATITQLEEEKSGLIGCIEEEEAMIKELKQKLEQEKQQSEKLKSQIKNIYDQLDESNQQIALIEKTQKMDRLQQSQLDAALLEKERLLQTNEEQMKNLNRLIADKQKEIMQYQFQLGESNNKLIEYEQANKDLSRQYSESVQQISMFKRQNEEQHSQINILNDNLGQLTYEYENFMSKTDRLEKQIKDSEKIANDRGIQLRLKDEQIQKLLKKEQKLVESLKQQERLENKVKELSIKLHELFIQKEKENMELEQDRQQKSIEITQLFEQIQHYQKENRQLKEQDSNQSSERQQIIEEYEKTRQLLETEKVEKARLEAEILEYKKIMEEKQHVLANFHTFEIKHHAELQQTQEEYENMQQSLRQEQFKNAQLEDELRNCKFMLQEKENATSKLHSLQLKYQAETEYYQQLISDLQMKISANQYYDISSQQRNEEVKSKALAYNTQSQSLRTSNDQLLFETFNGPLHSAKNSSQDFFFRPPPQNQNQDLQNIPVKQTTLPKKRYYL